MSNDVRANFEQFPQVKAVRALLGQSGTQFQSGLVELFASGLLDGVVELDLVVENQRGMKLFGTPFFSSKALIPWLDPPTFQLMNGKDVLNAREWLLEAVNNVLANNYPLPDIDWEWAWDTWYVVMLYDVDDQGWIYLYLHFRSSSWKGRYYFGNFVRRRIWARLRRRKGHHVNPLYLDVKEQPSMAMLGPRLESVLPVDTEMYQDGDTLLVGTPGDPAKHRHMPRLHRGG